MSALWRKPLTPSPDIIAELRNIVGPKGLIEGPDVSDRYVYSSSRYANDKAERPVAVVFPRDTAQVSAIVSVCHSHNQSIVPQGGLTGVVGGGCPSARDIVLSLERMNTIEEVDPVGRTMTAQAGVILQTAQEHLAAHGLAFPVDLGSRGTATLGGMVSTNAGGLQVVRYGMMRQSVLGLEVVLADGTVQTSMNRMLKDNAGYDLKQLFIGTEGTLGVVTRAVFRVNPKPLSVNTAFAGVNNFESLTALLQYLDTALNGTLTTFEVLWDTYYKVVDDLCPNVRLPLPAEHPLFVLIEAEGGNPDADRSAFEHALAECLDKGLVATAIVASSEQQRADIWAVRENAGEGFRALGQLITFDVSLPIANMNTFATHVSNEINTAYPESFTVVMGHVADGNLHVMAAADGGSAAAKEKIDTIVYDEIARLGGSISAEHGIGTFKKHWMPLTRSDEEIAMMKQMKNLLDPSGILNPGKVV